MEEAKAMPTHISMLSNEQLYVLAESGHHEANEERLVRNVMVVDNVNWEEASKTVKKIEETLLGVVPWATLPYKVGILTWGTTGFLAVPMVFSLSMAKWFNEGFVTMDVPEPKDLETCLEVGTWTWNWMEPPLGTASFVLLAMQAIRAQMVNMDYKPYAGKVREMRAQRLVQKYPQYNEEFVSSFAATAVLSM
jgi:hypothetical protein